MRVRARYVVSIALVLFLLGGAGYLIFQNTLVPLPLAEGRELYAPANPEFGEDAARLEALLPAGPKLEAFLAAQSDLPLIEKSPGGLWAGLLASGLQRARHERRWRATIRTSWPMQDGARLDAQRVATAIGPEVQRVGGEVRVIDPATLEFQFRSRQEDLPDQLARWRVPGSGPFIRQGHVLTRFDGFLHGKAGIAGLAVATDPALLESRAWADGLVSRRWAWAVFPGRVAPEDMARVRLAPYDELPMKDGSVWFLSRRLRRLRPQAADWTRTRLFGAWKSAVDLPYDPLGM